MMSISVQPLTQYNATLSAPTFFSELQERASQLFFKIKEHLFPLKEQEIPQRAVIDLGAVWRDPIQLIEGSVWGAWCAAGVYFLAKSLTELYNVITVELASDLRFEKIALAVKSAFVDLVSLSSSVLYTLRWADGPKIISLGCYLPLVKYLCYGTTLLINVVEAAFDLHQFGVEVSGLLQERGAILYYQRSERVCHLSMKLVSNICMTAWAILGIASLTGVVVHSALMPLLLGAGCVIGLAAIAYKITIDGNG